MTLIQQQRLIGATVLVCLIGVIAWFLLDTVEKNQPEKPKQEPITFDSVIEPIADDVDVVEPVEEATVSPDITEQTDKADQQAQLAENVTEPKTAPAPAPAPAPKVDSQQKTNSEKPQDLWVLQLASFSEKKNADALAARVKVLGHTPMIETTSNAGTLIYRVRLKPVSSRSELEQTAQTLNKKLGLSTQIQHYVP